MLYDYYVSYTYLSAGWGVGSSTIVLESKLDSADAIRECVTRVVEVHNENNAETHISDADVIILNFILLREVEATPRRDSLTQASTAPCGGCPKPTG